jgi:hypothetical protein
VDGEGDGKPIGNWEVVRERVEEGSTSGVSTINSNKSPKESMVVIINYGDQVLFFYYYYFNSFLYLGE